MKTAIFAVLLAALAIGCDQTSPSQQSNQEAMFSQESMLKYATASTDDPGLMNPNAGMHNGPRHGQMMEHMASFLGLSEDQQASVQQLGDNMFAELSSIRDEVQAGTLSHEDAQVRIHDLRAQFMEDIAALLTPEQLALLEQWEANRWERGHRRMGNGRHGR